MDVLQKRIKKSSRPAALPPLLRRPTRQDLLALARQRFVRGQTGDLEGLAQELGISRATAYLWAGNADQLSNLVIGELLVDAYGQAEARIGRNAPHRAAQVVVQVMRSIAGFRAYRDFVGRNPEKALRIVASKNGSVQRTAIAQMQGLLEAEQARGRLSLPVEPHAMAYALVRLVESFLYADFIAGEQPDLAQAEAIIRLLLGTHPGKGLKVSPKAKPARAAAR